MTKDDPLAQCVSEITTAANELGIELILGWVEEKCETTNIHVKSEVSNSHLAFIQRAKTLGARFTVLDTYSLEKADLDEAMLAIKEASETPERHHIEKTLEECKNRIGQVAFIDLTFVLPGTQVLASLQMQSPWHDAVYDTETELHDDAEPEDHSITDEKLEAIALELARQPRFQSAKNSDARTLEAKKFLRPQMGDGYNDWEGRRIIQTAKSIYENDIKPAKDAELRQKAEELASQGLTRSEMAQQLGITISELRRLS